VKKTSFTLTSFWAYIERWWQQDDVAGFAQTSRRIFPYKNFNRLAKGILEFLQPSQARPKTKRRRTSTSRQKLSPLPAERHQIEDPKRRPKKSA
jgi:hypothetical protein